MFFIIYRDTSNQWRWTLYAANNQKIADSGEGYWNESDCRHGIGVIDQPKLHGVLTRADARVLKE